MVVKDDVSLCTLARKKIKREEGKVQCMQKRKKKKKKKNKKRQFSNFVVS